MCVKWAFRKYSTTKKSVACISMRIFSLNFNVFSNDDDDDDDDRLVILRLFKP